MQTRTMNDLVNSMLAFISGLDMPRTDVDNWLKVISFNDIKQLKALLESLRLQGDAPLTAANCAPLVLFLQDRHARMYTDAHPCMRPDLPSVKAQLELARQLSPVLNAPAYNLLLGMDSKKLHFKLVGDDLSALPLHRIMIDKKGNPFDVVENLFGNIVPLQAQSATNPVFEKFLANDVKDKFESEEKSLLKEHSTAVKLFHSRVSANQVEEGKRILLDEFKNANFIVVGSYGASGMRLLKRQLFASLKSADDFVAYFANAILPNAWGNVLLDIEMSEFAHLMLNIDIPTSSGSEPNNITQLAQAIKKSLDAVNESHFNFALGERIIRAKLFIYAELYLFARSSLPDYTSFTGKIEQFTFGFFSTSYYTGNYSREEKTTAAKSFIEFLKSSWSLHELEAYLKSVDKLQLMKPLTIGPTGGVSSLVTLCAIAIKAGEHFRPRLNHGNQS